MSIITILLFFIYTWGLGCTASFFLKNADNFLERNLMRIGIGLGVFPVVVVVLNLLHIPLDWKLFLMLSLIVPLYHLFRLVKNKQLHFPKKFSLTKSDVFIFIVLLLFLATFFMYHKGAFSYPYLEDDDPWEHAKGVKYVALEKTATTPQLEEGYTFGYLDPYPPAYETLLGVLHQTSPSLNWTLKFFNALIISLGIIFFYFFAKAFMGDPKKALFSTFVLAAVPAYVSHFIWAHSLIPVLFFVAMYCLEKIAEDKRWLIPGILVIAGINFTHMEQPIKLGFLFLLYIVAKSLLQKKFVTKEFLTVTGGYLLSLLWWAFKWRAMWGIKLEGRLGEAGAQAAQEGGLQLLSTILSALPKIFRAEGGTATRAYSFSDFFVAQPNNLINNPIGIGVVVSILTLLGVLYLLSKYKSLREEKNRWLVISVLWLVFLFVFVNSATFHLPVGLGAFRIWMLLAIPVALVSTAGAWLLFGLSQNKVMKAGLVLLLVVGVLFTSGYQKYTTNTAMWPPGKSWTSGEELGGFVWMKDNLPIDSKVFSYANPKAVLGMDQFACVWCPEFVDFNKDVLSKNMTEVHAWLKQNQYEYLLFRGFDFVSYGKKLGEEEAARLLNQRMSEVASLQDKFQLVHQTSGFLLFKVR